jgi:uncharacterized membrane protein YGL010W
VAGGLFVGGWALQLVGHKVFEKNKPAFLSDPYYLLVGPVWVGAEWMELFGLPLPDVFHAEAPPSDVAVTEPATTEANGQAAATAS